MPNSIKVLESSGARDVAFSADQKRIYISDTTGNIRVFDVATGNQVASWHVSDSLGAISVSPDGSFLLASDPRQPLLYKVSTATGAVVGTITGTGTAYLDVQIVDATTAIATGSKPTSINLTDNSLTPLTNASYYSGQSYLTKDHYLTLFGESGISNGPLFLYDSRTHAIVAHGDDYQSTATGFNYGIQAVSEAAGEVVQGIYSTTLNIYDLNIKFIKSVNLGATITGVAFDQSGAHLYVSEAPTISGGAGTVVEYDTATLNTVATYAAGTLGSVNSSTTNYGNNLLLSSDSRYIAVTDPASGSVKLIDTQSTAYSTITGTDAADTLTGTTSDDTILAGAGNDTINASKGQDYVDGGAGTDTLVVKLGNTSLFDAVSGSVTYAIAGTTGSSGTAGTVTSSAGGLNTSFTSIETIAITGVGDAGDRLTSTAAGLRINATLGNGANTVDLSGSTGGYLSLTAGSGNDVVRLGSTTNGSLNLGLGANTVTGGGAVNIQTAVDSHLAPATVRTDANNTTTVSYRANDGSLVVSTFSGRASGSIAVGSGVAGQGLNVDASQANGVVLKDSAYDDTLIGSHKMDTFASYNGGISTGSDLKIGNGGADDFDYSLAQPTDFGDHIADLDADDVLDFSYYGNTVASPTNPAVQIGELTFIGTAAFDGKPQELRYEAHDGKTYIQVDENGDKIADGQVTIDNGAFTLVDTQAYGGKNQLQIATAQTMVTGTDGADTLAGTNGSDTIRGYAGNDVIQLSAGQDFIDGGAGRDTVAGTIVGGQSVTITDGRIDGGGLNTALLNIEAVSLQTSDTGGAVRVDAHTATVDVSVVGGSGDDYLAGGSGNDTLVGGGGNDTLIGGAGVDTLTGGAGADSFQGTRAELSGDTVTDFSAGDRIVVTDADPASFRYTLSGATLGFTGGGSLSLTGLNGARLVQTTLASGGVALSLGAHDPHLADTNGDGHSDIVWTRGGAVSTWTVSGNGTQLTQNSFFASVDSSWHVQGTLDVNGDGRADILWRNDNGALAVWKGTGGGFDQASYYHAPVGTDWTVAGTGDWNGDGRDDIVWRNANGAVSTWTSTSTGTTTGFAENSFYANVGTDWRLAATGDINGDGRTDLVWQNVNGQVAVWTANTSGGFDQNAPSASVGANSGWTIAGVGDLDGDGRGDILWHNADGRLSVWQSTATGFAQNVASGSADPSWQVAQIGDFNGDGRMDVLFHNTNGAISTWQSNGHGFDQNILYNPGPSTDWHVQVDVAIHA